MKRLLTHDWPLLLGFYALGYALFGLCYGWGFSEHDLLYFSQHLHPAWLKDNLFQSLLYLHSQPPLMNMLIGIIFKISEEHHRLIFRLLYAALGIAAIHWINASMRLYDIGRGLRMALIVTLCLFPTLHLYGTWYFNTHIEFALFAGMMYYFTCFYRTPARAPALIKCFALLALLGLLRGQWHLLVLLGFMVMMLVIEKRGFRKQIILASLIFMLPMSAWYAKNQILFGFFGPSSWMGSNLAQVASAIEPPSTLGFYKRLGAIGPHFPVDVNMFYVVKYVPPEALPEGLPEVLGNPVKEVIGETTHYNANYLGIITTARQDFQDSLFIISENPGDYFRHVLRRAWSVISTPSAFHPYTELYNIKATLPPLPWYCMAQILYFWMPLIVLATRWKKQPELLPILALLAANLVISCAFNGIEQERMRWASQAAYVLLAAFFLENMLKWWNKMRHGRNAEHP